MQEWARKSGKILIGTIVSALLILPFYADALGFGNIKVKSALNEPLDAEIELLSATDEDVKDLEVKLASREAFLRAGVDRSAQLTAIKFTVSKRSGKYYVYLKTPQSVREPFMNFLLEMNWKNGRMLREYTVLLDPPDRKQTQVAAAPEPTLPSVAVQPETAPAPAVAPAPVASPFAVPEPAPIAEPVTVTPAAEPAVAPIPAPAPEVAAAPETPKPDKKKGTKKSKKGTKKSATPVAEPVAPAPSMDIAGGTTTAPVQDDGLFPRLPLDENNEVDVKALEESIKQSQAERKDDVVAAEPPPAAIAPEPVPAVAPVAEPTQEVAAAAVPAEPATAPAEAAPSPGPEMAGASGALDYGITRKGDNLWTVASKLKPSEEVTIYQVMMALQQSNPDAFVKGNIHRLKANQVLRIEDPRLLTAMSKEQAAKHYQEQTNEWKDYLASVGAQVPRQAIVAGDAGTQAEATSSIPSGELTLSPPSGEGEGVGSGQSDKLAKKQNTDQLRKQVQKAVADAETERRKNTELASRVEDLEKELKRLENLVTVKDSDLAALQRKLEEVQKQRAGKAPTKPVEIAEAPAAPVVTPAPVEQPKPAAPTEIAATTPPEQSPTPAVEAVKPEQTAPTEQVTPPAPTPKAAPTVAPVKPVEKTGFIANVMGMLGGLGMYLIIGGVVLLLLLILLLVWMRRRNKVYFQESILKGGATTMDSQLNSTTASAPVSSQSSLMSGGESSFLSDFAISGVSAIQAEDSEVDPLTEADVFMAYGRYEAAEERLNEAIKQDPNRGELRVKLLELFSTTKNKKAFETAAEDYYAALGGQTGSNPLWQKVVSMGADIAPNNPLFKGGSGGGFTSTSNLNDSKVMDIGLDTGAFRKGDFAAPAAPSKPAPAKADDSLDFNLDFEDKTVIPPAKTSDEENTEAGLDFNLDFGGETKPSAPSPAPVTTHDDALDFNLDMSEDEEPTATDIKFDEDEEVTGELDFDLESPGPGGAGRTGNRSTMEMDLDASDAINLDMPTGGDEVGTKLDLARAYIDMGDPDGARSILDEVMTEGSEGQKQEARQLMSQIG